MHLRSTVAALAVLAFAAPSLALAAPTVVDFEVAPASGIPAYSTAGVTFTSGGPGGTVNLLGGPNASGNLLGNYVEDDNDPGNGVFDVMRADFSTVMGWVSVDLGDYPSIVYGDGDDETLFLNVYDANDVLLGGALLGITQFEPNYKTLSVAAAGIKYATFGSVGGFGGSSVYADNFSFQAGVPEPSMWALTIVGFGGLGAMMRRRRALSPARI